MIVAKADRPATALTAGEPGQPLYILGEPWPGLHFEDVRKLLEMLYSPVEQGDTVVVIEHSGLAEVIKTVGWVIDLGLEGGDKGGATARGSRVNQVCEAAE